MIKKPPTTTATVADLPTDTPQAGTPSLKGIREESLRLRFDAARTISELEAWRDEIDATIAFLKAQRR